MDEGGFEMGMHVGVVIGIDNEFGFEDGCDSCLISISGTGSTSKTIVDSSCSSLGQNDPLRSITLLSNSFNKSSIEDAARSIITRPPRPIRRLEKPRHLDGSESEVKEY